jgi:phosphomannomutase
MHGSERLACFKAYDIRGKVPEELDTELAYGIGRGFSAVTGAERVCVGRDARLSGLDISGALVAGLRDAGVDVVDIGVCGTEEIYFATSYFDLDGGIVVTASHNPQDYNGMKLVRRDSKPISSDSGLDEIEQITRTKAWSQSVLTAGSLGVLDHREAYIQHLLSQVDTQSLRPLKIVCNAGHGVAGPVMDQLARSLPFEIERLQWQPDGSFPEGVPNPLLPECREVTRRAVIERGADFGIAWDGDFDRCFFFDSDGRFIEGYYIVGLIAEAMLVKTPGAKISHDPRLTWNTVDVVAGAGGIPIMTKTGHAFIKERMRLEDALYGGEMSAHHYLRDFFYCDSGMLPWLMVAELMCRKKQTLAQLVDASLAAYPCSGELNFRVKDATVVLAALRAEYSDDDNTDFTDGLSVELEGWRFNVRASNTEPLLRLNVESRAQEVLMQDRTRELSDFIKRFAA